MDPHAVQKLGAEFAQLVYEPHGEEAQKPIPETPGNPHQRSQYGLDILKALDHAPGGPKHVYAGTVKPAEKARRRAVGRRAKQARKANRG